MRELLFRAWNPYQNRMMPIVTVDKVGEYPAQCFDYLMQYAGRKDKDGKMIFEGDIVEIYAGFGTRGRHPKSVGPFITVLGVVEFDGGGFCYKEPKHEYQKRISAGNATDWYRTYPELHECRVIGNIHEHAHLIEPQ